MSLVGLKMKNFKLYENYLRRYEKKDKKEKKRILEKNKDEQEIKELDGYTCIRIFVHTPTYIHTHTYTCMYRNDLIITMMSNREQVATG